MRNTPLYFLGLFGCTPLNLLPIQEGPPSVEVDSDGDGFLDTEETEAGSDPLDKFSWDFGGERWPDFTDEATADGYAGEGYGLGDVMPDFVALDQFGNEVSLSTFYGYVIFIDFSAGWCEPCQVLAENAQEMWETYRLDGFMIVHVVIDDEVQSGSVEPEFLQTWSSRYGLEFPVVLDDNQVAHLGLAESGLYQNSVPFMVLLDRDMTIDSTYTGSTGDLDATPQIEALLGL